MNWIANATVETNGKISGTDIDHLHATDRTPAGIHLLPEPRVRTFHDETRVPFRNIGARARAVSFRTVAFRRETAPAIAAAVFRDISRSSRLAHGLLSPSPVNERRHPTAQEKEAGMLEKLAPAIVVAGAPTTTVAHAG